MLRVDVMEDLKVLCSEEFLIWILKFDCGGYWIMSQQFQSSDLPNSCIQPDRHWFVHPCCCYFCSTIAAAFSLPRLGAGNCTVTISGGPIPSELRNLTNLVSLQLDLYLNSFNGPIPPFRSLWQAIEVVLSVTYGSVIKLVHEITKFRLHSGCSIP